MRPPATPLGRDEFSIRASQPEVAMKVKKLRNESMTRSYRVELNRVEFQSELFKALVNLEEIVGKKRLKRGRITLEEARGRFGEEAAEDAVVEVIDAAVDVLLKKTGDSVMEPPDIEMVRPENGGSLDGGFTFEVTYDLKPHIPELDFSGIDFKRLVVTPTDDELEFYLDAIATSFADKPGPAERGDLVAVSYSGTVDGITFVGGDEDDLRMEIGSGYMPGLEEKLVGLSTGDRKLIEARLPDRMPERFGSGAELIAGKTAVFEVEIKGVLAVVEVAKIDDDLAKRCGADDLDDLKAKVRETLKFKSAGICQEILIDELLTILNDMVSFEMGTAGVEAMALEIAREEWRERNPDEGESDDVEVEVTKEHYEIAEMQQRNSYLLAELATRTNSAPTLPEVLRGLELFGKDSDEVDDLDEMNDMEEMEDETFDPVSTIADNIMYSLKQSAVDHALEAADSGERIVSLTELRALWQEIQ